MKLVKSLLVALTVALATFSFSESSMTAEEMIVEAEQANAAAAAIGYEWRDTGSFIADAKKALAAGKTEQAFDLAQKAYEQAVLAKQQGDYMAENWQQYIPM